MTPAELLLKAANAPTLLSDPEINELSLIFADHKGAKWAPRNSEAVVLALKGAGDTTRTIADVVKAARIAASSETMKSSGDDSEKVGVTEAQHRALSRYRMF